MVLLLTTTGRNSGCQADPPLIYQRHGDDYLVAKADREIPVVVLEPG